MRSNRQDGTKWQATAFETSAQVWPDVARVRQNSAKAERAVQENTQRRLLEDFHTAMLDEEWKIVQHMIEIDPYLSYELVPLTLQGEDTLVFPLAAAAAYSSRSLHGGVPISLFEALVTANPMALLHGDSRGNRVPLMIALMTLTGGTATTMDSNEIAISVAKIRCIRYLLQSWSPKVLQLLDSQGNVALHYAARYCSSTSCGCRSTVLDKNAASLMKPSALIVEEMISAYPEAAQVCNRKQQLPLHLLVTAAVAADNGSPDASLCCISCTIRSLEVLIQAYPQALRHKDRQGRLPLHVACASSSHPSWDVLQVLIDSYPTALACEDGSGKIPLDLWNIMSPFRTGLVGSVAGTLRGSQRRSARKRTTGVAATTSGDNDLILACLQECTRRKQEQNRQHRFLGRVLSGLRGNNSIGVGSGRKKDSTIIASFNNCYG